MKPLREILSPSQTMDRANRTHLSILDHYNNYSHEERPHLVSYMGDSRDLNSYHWEKHKNNLGNLDKLSKQIHEEQTQHIDTAIQRHKTPMKLAVWSGTMHDPRRLMNEQGIVHHPAYLSTSLSEEKAKMFAGLHYSDSRPEKHLMKIHIPQGHPGAYVGHFMTRPTEREFILPRGTNLKHVKTEVTKDYSGDTYHVHHMRVV